MDSLSLTLPPRQLRWAKENLGFLMSAIDQMSQSAFDRLQTLHQRQLDLLRPILIISMSGPTVFSLEDFIEGIKKRGMVREVHMHGHFESWFAGKFEKDLPTQEIRASTMLDGSQGVPYTTEQEIIERIGIEKAELCFAHFCNFVATARRDYWYCGFARCAKGHLRAVHAQWHGSDLHLTASHMGFTDEKMNGGCVVSQDFV